MVQNWPQNDPKLAKNGLNGPKKSRPKKSQKIPKNPQKIEKMAKNGPTEPHVIALKRVRMHCKWSKTGRKIKNIDRMRSEQEP